jgi:hypothetical protein
VGEGELRFSLSPRAGRPTHEGLEPARFLADEPGDCEDDRGVEGIDELDERGHAAA